MKNFLKWETARWMQKFIVMKLVRPRQINESMENYFDPEFYLVRSLQGPFLSRLLLFTAVQGSLALFGSFSNYHNWIRFDILNKMQIFSTVLSCLVKNPSFGLLTVTCTLGFLRIFFRGNREMDSLHYILAEVNLCI
jgi:hypothetical protein